MESGIYSNLIPKSSTLFQEYCGIAYAREDSQWIKFISNNKRTFRAEL